MFTDRLYTGQRQIAELGVYHFNARFYSPKLGRFLSADTVMSGFANPQNLNRFAYVANNPVRYTDPTGHMICAFCDGGGDFPDSSPPPEPESPVTDPKTDPDDDSGDGGGGGGDYCATHPGSCGLPIPTVTPIGTLPSSSTQDSSTEPPNPSVFGLVAVGLLLHTAIVITEIGLIAGEVVLAAYIGQVAQ